MMNNENLLFALDIGTRSIVGVMLKKKEDRIIVEKIVSREHSNRAMIDGQIHDIAAVSKLISKVKEEMESLYGPLNRVYVAAAGRSLKTVQAKETIALHGKQIETKDITHLELIAVQKAQKTVVQENKGLETDYFCVGYSVLYYYLDGDIIGNPLDQRGTEFSVEIIATFLPKIVIDSLDTAIRQSGLEIAGLTLEPIAAIELLIPDTMRRLNIALVDIGAGTSDIAVTSKGTVINYGMVPVAGDEITEAVSDQYILDFPVAERIKKEATVNDTVTFTDILGFQQEVARDDLVQNIKPAVEKLARQIAQEIMRINSLKTPQAVMLIGGGSLSPGLADALAQELKLPANRVAVQSTRSIPNLSFIDDIEASPDLITPVSIGLSASKNPLHYKTVYVNDIPVRHFEVKPATVGDSLLTAGIQMNKLYGKPGLAKIITVNGKTVTIPGSFGTPPVLMKNGEPASFDDLIHDGDKITVKKGNDGKEATLTLYELLDAPRSIQVTINEQHYVINPTFFVNGKQVDGDYIVRDRDKIEWTSVHTVKDILVTLNLAPLEDFQPFTITINDQKITVPEFSGKISRNNEEIDLNAAVFSGDMLEIKSRTIPTVADLARNQGWNLYATCPVTFNGEPVTLTKPLLQIYRGGKALQETDQIFNGDILIVERQMPQPFIFQDVFKFVSYHPPSAMSGTYQLMINGTPATFHEVLSPGDELEIRWVNNRTTLPR